MRRLFWTFPDGLPGAGLLLMRLSLGGGLLGRCQATWPTEPMLLIALCAVEGMAAMLLLAGLCTPVWGAGTALIELWRACTNPDERVVHLLLATLGAALVLLGPGAFSIDARMFGWRRIDVPSKGSTDDSN